MSGGPRRPFHRARLRYDAGFRTELAFCVERGIPHSVYLATWSHEDRAKVVAFLMEKSERCQLCGTAPWEWEHDPHAYEPAREVCLGCQKKDLLRDDGEKVPAGSSVVLIPKRVARMRRAAARRAKQEAKA